MPVFRNLATNPAFETATSMVETTQGTKPFPDGVGVAGNAEAWQAQGVGRYRPAALAIQWLSFDDYRLRAASDAQTFDLIDGQPGTLRETREQGVYDILPGGQIDPTTFEIGN